ncbi:hypothetical protein WA026_019334 [Henosepilachna vigintioctopunctata]|uniref:Tyr recombinase domain-containing protein n=1 Tax=Henosepilachna vigintioctopunctata TaxID=420089 RepID=A0AAW1U9B0_9CUCU
MKNKFQRNVTVASRVKTFINLKANSIMRNKILPHIRVDTIGKLVRNEELIILFGNRLTQKYRSPHLYKMIRSRLRCVANFYWHYQQRNHQVQTFSDLFDPQNYDEVVICINKMAGQYKSPTTAANIGTYLKKISLHLISEMIKSKNQIKLQVVREFLQLLEDSLTYDIYKTVAENQLDSKRNKTINLPTINDINLLRNHLNEKIKINYKKLREKFSVVSWKELSGALLIALQLFNRRRAGEIERTKIQDFEQYEAVNVNDEMACDLKCDHIENYVRFLIRGKRGRDVPVLVDKYKLKCLKLVLETREMAGTLSTNPYVFGVPGKDGLQHLVATKLIVHYAKNCGAEYPQRLRGTLLRKHFATKCGTMNLKEVDLKDVADYMGHHEKIHLEHYRMPNATRDIVRMSRILEKAQGIETSPSCSPLNICNKEKSGAEWNEDSIVSKVNANDLEDTQLNSSRKRCYKKRLTWSQEEKTLVDVKAKFYFENCESPTLSYCKTLIKEEILLKNRTPITLKAYIMNRIKQQKMSLINPTKHKGCKRGVKRFWSEEEKNEVNKLFQKELKDNKLPSMAVCRKVIMENSILSNRTPEMLRAFLNNTFKRNK